MMNPPGQPPQGMPPNYPQQGYPQQQQYPQQGYPQQQQQYQQQQYQQQQYQQQQYPQGMQPGAQASGGKRNPVLIAVGAVLMLISLGVGALFMLNFYQYSTVEDRWAEDSKLGPAARDFGVRIVKKSAMNKMTVFGPVSAVFGIPGLILIILGARKKQ